MTDAELNAKIAELCGKCPHPFEFWEKWICEDGNDYTSGLTCKKCGKEVSENRVPDFCNSLDAMHEAEKTLTTSEQQNQYFNELFCLLPCDENHGPVLEGGEDVMTPSPFTQIHATARQRAEAFLKCLDKGRD